MQAVVEQGTLNGEVQEAHRAIEVQPKLHLKVKENVANTPIFSVKLQKSYPHLWNAIRTFLMKTAWSCTLKLTLEKDFANANIV